MTTFSTLPPAVAIHLSASLGALVLGPVALWARRAVPPTRACTAPPATPG